MSDILLMKVTCPTRDYSPRSQTAALEQFMESSIYKDFLGEINMRLEDMRDFLETCPRDMYEETRGGIAAVRMMAGIFTDLHNNSIEDKRGDHDGE